METKTVVILLGVVFLIAGIALMMVTEPAGTEGSQTSWGVADVSEDVRPYFWYGAIVLLLGIVLLVIALVKI